MTTQVTKPRNLTNEEQDKLSTLEDHKQEKSKLLVQKKEIFQAKLEKALSVETDRKLINIEEEKIENLGKS